MRSLFGDDALADLGSLAGTLPEVVELRPADDAVTDHLDAADAGAVIGEGTLHAHAVGDTADGEGLADAAALHLDDDAFEVLQTLVGAFHDLHVHPDLIADLQLRQVGTQLFFFQFLNDIKACPEDAMRTAEVFDLLLGDNLAGRKLHIETDGKKYLDMLDLG